MNAPAAAEKFCKALRVALITGFVLALWLPLLDSFFGLDATPPANENRQFAKFPELKGIAGLKSFLAGVEAYFNDHFGFRKRLVAWNNQWKHDWFHEAPFSSVLAGRDGWLFFTSDQMVEHFTGLARLTAEDLDTWQTLLEARRDWLARLGTKYVFVIAPDKPSVYPEYLPDWLKKGEQPLKLDQFISHMKANSTVPVLDLRGPLLAAKSTSLVYPLTDTHWNSLGAFIACREIIQTLSHEFPELLLQPLSLDAFERKPLPAYQGDLARMAGQMTPETNLFTLTPRPPLTPLDQTNGKSRPQKRWPQVDPIITLNPTARGEAILFRDSFANNMIPFLGYRFNETVYVGRLAWDFAFLERERPAVVIDEVAERTFNILDPKILLRAHLEATQNFHALAPHSESSGSGKP